MSDQVEILGKVIETLSELNGSSKVLAETGAKHNEFLIELSEMTGLLNNGINELQIYCLALLERIKALEAKVNQ